MLSDESYKLHCKRKACITEKPHQSHQCNNRLEMENLVDEIVEVTQCEPALAQAVLRMTNDVGNPVSCALFVHNLHFCEAATSALS